MFYFCTSIVDMLIILRWYALIFANHSMHSSKFELDAFTLTAVRQGMHWRSNRVRGLSVGYKHGWPCDAHPTGQVFQSRSDGCFSIS